MTDPKSYESAQNKCVKLEIVSFHVASRKKIHNQDVFLSDKSFQSEKVLRSQAVAILKDEWRLERNIIEV